MVEINNKTKSRIDLALVKKIAEKFLEKQKLSGKTISIALVGDTVIRRLSREYRRQDRITDVLAFPGEGDYLGEIIIGWPQIKRQAGSYSGSVKAELAFILAHGLFHLLGFDDRTGRERDEMDKVSREFLKEFKI